MRRAGVALARFGLLAFEVLLIQQYVVRGTAWHGLIHSLTGLGAGLAVAALVTAARSRPTRALGWAVLGQLVAVLPDFLYILGNLPHRRWMDLFIGHIAVHTAWAPVLLTLGFFLAAGWAWWLACLGRARAGSLLALSASAVLLVALVRAEPVPTRLLDFPPGAAATSAYAGAFVCQVPAVS